MSAIADTKRWIERVVIGLNICPFAKRVYEDNTIRYQVSSPESVIDLLHELVEECRRLDKDETISTTLLIYPDCLESFEDFLDMLAAANDRLVEDDYEGIYQLASFHPAYVFDGCEPGDPANFTNRAPFPMLHLIREAELSGVLASYPNPEKIPERNMRVCREMGHEALRAVLLSNT